MSSIFEPKTVIAILKNSSLTPPHEKKGFESIWKNAVDKRRDAWLRHRGLETKTSQGSAVYAQLDWEANVVEYVSRIYKETKCHGNAKNAVPRSLSRDVPLLGPRFLPPAFLHEQKRQHNPRIEPTTAYIKPLNVIHPLYYDNIGRCPRCAGTNILWSCWTPTGHREVHGIHEEENALGYQLICKTCQDQFSHIKGKEGVDEGMYCFATTNSLFWEKWEHWEMPRNVPYFWKRTAVTQDLFNLIIELRPSLTSFGLHEHIRQLHLLTHKQKMLEYVQVLKHRIASPFQVNTPTAFSEPLATNGYNDKHITDETITHILNDFSEKTRRKESEKHLQTLSAKCIALDNTFKSAGKATVVDKEKRRTKLIKGGILNVLNENGEIIGWRFCVSSSPDEITEFLEGYMRRCTLLRVAPPEMVVVDNCCQMRNAIQKAIPGICVVLDVYHFQRRYLAVIINGTKNPHHTEVAKDITEAIIKTRAEKGVPATYWNKEDQIERLESAFEKWARKGTVWSVAASKVHAEQLRHVQKGCLARIRDDIAADGSRVEASHKGWNSIQRSFSSGIEVFNALAHDFVLRRNIRIASSRKNASAFVESTHGSHHIDLTHRIAELWNQAVEKHKKPNTNLQKLPEMVQINSGERFGLCPSKHVTTFDRIIEQDTESVLEWQGTSESYEQVLDHEMDDYLQDLDIKPAQRLVPMGDSTDTIQLGDNSYMQRQDDLTVLVATEDVQAESTSNPSKRKANMVEVSERASKKACTTLASSPIPPQRKVNEFFRSNTQSNRPLTIEKSLSVTRISVTPSESIQQLAERFTLPDSRALTRSQCLFSLATNIDVRSLEIKGDGEFLLFMKMREEHQWVTFSMTSKKWVIATHQYNTRLELSSERTGPMIKKIPRALLIKLGDVEAKVLTRLATGDFISKRSKTDMFWKHHCHAVRLLTNDGDVKDGDGLKICKPAQRKPAKCSRCQTMMYPGPLGSPENHRKGYCSDGVWQGNDAPMWPQPQGIFERGRTFHPVRFLTVLREIYDAVIVKGSDGGDSAMEYHAFLTMLKARTVSTSDGQYLFELYNLVIPPGSPSELVVTHEGSRYLRVDCLQDDDPM